MKELRNLLQNTVSILLLATLIFRIFYPKYACSIFLQNICVYLLDYTVTCQYQRPHIHHHINLKLQAEVLVPSYIISCSPGAMAAAIFLAISRSSPVDPLPHHIQLFPPVFNKNTSLVFSDAARRSTFKRYRIQFLFAS